MPPTATCEQKVHCLHHAADSRPSSHSTHPAAPSLLMPADLRIQACEAATRSIPNISVIPRVEGQPRGKLSYFLVSFRSVLFCGRCSRSRLSRKRSRGCSAHQPRARPRRARLRSLRRRLAAKQGQLRQSKHRRAGTRKRPLYPTNAPESRIITHPHHCSAQWPRLRSHILNGDQIVNRKKCGCLLMATVKHVLVDAL